MVWIDFFFFLLNSVRLASINATIYFIPMVEVYLFFK